MKKKTGQPQLAKSELIEQIPPACSNEVAAVELFESLRWGKYPACVHCGSLDVYKMVDSKTGERNKRFLWRCHDCKKQYTVRIGTVYEESRIELRHWAYAFWRASTSKKGVAALEIMRQCQISYKSALFLMNRIRFAMAPQNPEADKLVGTVECDETYVGGKPRYRGTGIRGRGTKKTPVFVAVERNGRIRRRILANVSGVSLKIAVRELVNKKARLVTDELPAYRNVGCEMEGGHETVSHGTREYVRGDIYTNTAESSFAILKRGISGIYHSVSKEHLRRCLWQFDFLWNLRKMNDGERTVAAIKAAEGKRLMYKQPTGALTN
jgi:transposase-like protein